MEERVCNTCGKSKPLDAFRIAFQGQNAKLGYVDSTSLRKRCHACQTFRERMMVKASFLSAYGGKCSCCGEDDPRFLTLDHVHNDGKEDRNGRPNYIIMRQAVTNFRPDLYQILCFNCNFAKFHNKGICPHKDKSKEAYLTWLDGIIEKKPVVISNRFRKTKVEGAQKLVEDLLRLGKISNEDIQRFIKGK